MKQDKYEFSREELKQFWEIETMGKPEQNVIYQSENEIQFTGIRYVTNLPSKTEHDLLPKKFEAPKT